MNYEILNDFEFENSAGVILNFKAGEHITFENSYHFTHEAIASMVEEGTIRAVDVPSTPENPNAPASDTTDQPVTPDPTSTPTTPSESPDTTDQPNAPVNAFQQAYDGPMSFYKITGICDYSDEAGNKVGELEIDSIQKLPTPIGSVFVSEGVAVEVNEDGSAVTLNTDGSAVN